MPSARGAVVLGAGALLWIAARLVGSGDLHIVSVGVIALPFLAAGFARWSRQQLALTRRMTMNRVRPGQRVNVELEVHNRSAAPTSFLLLEDRIPATLGRPARIVLTGLPGRNSQRVSYSLVCRTRGRYHLGPTTVDISDPFALSRMRVEFPERDELVVFPEVEPLEARVAAPYGSGTGDSASRHLFRSGDEFYTMREYQVGDDLRRIHWPSVARRGRLMIRQDEAARRSTATVFLDTRVTSLGQSGAPAFEKAVSAAASVGSLLGTAGFTIRLATAQGGPASLGQEALLDRLAGVSHAPNRALGPLLAPLRAGGAGGTTLVVVTAPPPPAEVAVLTRTGATFGSLIAVLVYPADPSSLPPEAAARLEGQASAARLSLARAGWETYVIAPNAKLRDVWRATRRRPLLSTASSR
jgi:uncharacterized protein (DUF58 family)